MASIRTGIELNDGFSSVMEAIAESCYGAINAMLEVQDVAGASVNTSGFDDIVDSANRVGQEIDDSTAEQEKFNRAIRSGVDNSNELLNKIGKIAVAYASVQTVQKVMDMSDDLTMTTARLNMMNSAFNEINGSAMETSELIDLTYRAAQNARGSFSDMADVVAKFGNNARDAFSSQEEVVAFANVIQKQMTIAGASTAEASNAMLQLSQALGSGVLRGDELNSIFEQAPNLIQSIADYLEVPIGSIREMAQEGELTADVVKAAILDAANMDKVNAQFNAMPRTWGQIWTSMANTALIQFQPVLDKVNELANNEQFQAMLTGIINGLATVAGIMLDIMDTASRVASNIQSSWSVIAPLVYGIVAALGAYLAVSTAVNIINGIMAVSEGVKAASQAMATGATFAETAAQYGLNSALMACPITWIILAVIAFIAVVMSLCSAVAEASDTVDSAFGVICGAIATVGAFFKNLGLTIANVAIGIWNSIKVIVSNIGTAFQNLGMSVANIALGIWNAIGAVCQNIGTAFHNVIANVKGWWYGLLSDILTVIEGVCAALNKLPFVEFDYTGLSNAASEYAAKSAEAYDSKEEYADLLEAFNQGMSTYEMKGYESVGEAFSDNSHTFDTWQEGWAGDAFQAGAEWGDSVSDKVSDWTDNLFGGAEEMEIGSDELFGTGGYEPYEYTPGDYAAAQVPDDISDIAGNTASMANSLDATNEQLKYLRDIAEQEAINRFTTAEIHIEQNNTNNIGSEMDLDGVVNGLTDAVNEAVTEITEGVHA